MVIHWDGETVAGRQEHELVDVASQSPVPVVPDVPGSFDQYNKLGHPIRFQSSRFASSQSIRALHRQDMDFGLAQAFLMPRR